MKKLILGLALLGLSSCEFDTITQDSQADTPERTRLNQAIQPIVALNPQQRTMARRICTHLRIQRLKLESLPNGTEQFFRTREKTCPNERVQRNQVRAELQRAGAGPSWQTRQFVNLHSPILTDRSSVFDRLCDDLNADLEVENTQLISGRQIQFDLRPFASDDLDTVKLITYEMQNGSWRAQRIDEYDIDRSSDDPDDQGRTLAQKHRYFCNGSDATGELWQQAL